MELVELFESISLDCKKELYDVKDLVYKAIEVDLDHLVECFKHNNFDMIDCENPYYHYLNEKQLIMLKDVIKSEYVYNTFLKKIRQYKPCLNNDDYINIGTLIEYYYDN